MTPEQRAIVERLRDLVLYRSVHDALSALLASYDSYKRDAERLRGLIAEHNKAIEATCGRQNEYNRKVFACDSYYPRDRDCPNCPRDWLIDDAAGTEGRCWCYKCRPVTMTDMRMVLCPLCGNKRCPHASDHELQCTQSNEPGQPGSVY